MFHRVLQNACLNRIKIKATAIRVDKPLLHMKGKPEEGSESLVKQFLMEIYPDRAARHELS